MRHDSNACGAIALRPSLRPFVTLAVAVCLIAGLLVVEPPASAAPGWSAVPSPTPAGYGQVYLNGVSCPSTTNCFAVGSQSPPYTEALVEHWNGHTWSIMTSPNPTGAFQTQLIGVSCPSTTNCFAVGYFQHGSSPRFTKTLVEHWDGKRWSIMTSPNPKSSANSFLNGVSCRATTCFAVGFTRVPNSLTLVEHWDGIRWSIMKSPNPAGSQHASLGGVSCPITTSCFASGGAQFSSGPKTLIERWNGHKWSIMTSPNPTHASIGTISCSSTASCVAVGNYWAGGAAYAVGAIGKSLAERWDGHTWSVMNTPNPTHATVTGLIGVSCPTPAQCFAVGTFDRNVPLGYTPGVATVEKTLAEHWNGHAWSIITSPDPTRRGGFYPLALNAVSCHDTTNCFAVGDYGTQDFGRTTLIERYR